MRPPSLVESLFSRHTAGLPLPPVSGGDGADDKHPETPPAAPDLNKLVEAVIAKAGDPNAALKSLVADNYALRDDLKTIRARLPGEGSIVLTGDDARDWGAYRTIGKPSDLRKTVEEHGQLAARVGTFERDEQLRAVAEKAGVKFPVLRTLAGSLAFGEAKVKGKDGKEVPVVTVKDGDAEPVPFDAYAAEKWGDFLPALKPGGKLEPAPKQPGTPSRHESHRPAPNAAHGGDAPPPLSRGGRLLATARNAI